jgi:maltooligosyltrehalose trehalohydrolase
MRISLAAAWAIPLAPAGLCLADLWPFRATASAASMTQRHDMPFGARLLPGGGVRFRLWAPDRAQVQLQVERGASGPSRRPMQPREGGWHELVVAEAGAGTRYRFVMDDGHGGELAVPDPASRFNPEDVHGPSMVMDPTAYAWRDGAWRGRPWHEAVVYELHLGTFTPEGTYAAAMARLPDLVTLGVTAIELLPLADFPGRHGWGYDGVLHYAPDASHGTPDQLKALVDEAHRLGLMVLLDVVYNHFGPDGNYLHAYCSTFFNPKHQTPWGAAINFDGEGSRTVRDFYVHNALYWVEEFHFDGLRMDAVHAIRDDSPEHLCAEIGRALRDGPGRQRAVHLVLENDLNQAHLLTRDAEGRPRIADAQWNDDLHHAAHVLLTGQVDGYYADYADDPVKRLARCLAEGFAYQGEPSSLREGEARGEPSAQLPSIAFVSFLQNHDQIGNRAFGERLHQLCDPRALQTVQACLLLSPHVPMLFMGEEFDAATPFLYFCDFEGELAEAVSNGRREEFKRFAAFADSKVRASIPDPNDEATFVRCKLDWSSRTQSPHRERLDWLRRILQVRHEQLVPRMAGQREGGHHRVDGGRMQVMWTLGDGSTWRMDANFGDEAVPCQGQGETLFSHAWDGQSLMPHGLRVAREQASGG